MSCSNKSPTSRFCLEKLNWSLRQFLVDCPEKDEEKIRLLALDKLGLPYLSDSKPKMLQIPVTRKTVEKGLLFKRKEGLPVILSSYQDTTKAIDLAAEKNKGVIRYFVRKCKESSAIESKYLLGASLAFPKFLLANHQALVGNYFKGIRRYLEELDVLKPVDLNEYEQKWINSFIKDELLPGRLSFSEPFPQDNAQVLQSSQQKVVIVA